MFEVRSLPSTYLGPLSGKRRRKAQFTAESQRW
jgi:hypothetical protein